MAVTTSSERRAAAELRRRAAGEAGERGGDAAFAAYRAQVPGVGAARRVPTTTQLRAVPEKRNGKDHIHTFGFFTRYNMAYPMWDRFGEYFETFASGTCRDTIAARPDVAFLVNHAGVTMARTASDATRNNREPTLVLEERGGEGGWHDAWLNPERQDVSDLVVAIDDEHVTQMSCAFMIPEGSGEWSEDFTEFVIRSIDLNRGDVSAVNYGANPYTDISARSSEILADLERLPEGAARAAARQLIRRGLARPEAASPSFRERIEVSGRPERVEPVVVTQRSAASSQVRRLAARRTRTAGRFVELAAERGLSVAELVTAQLPWYEIRNADGDADMGAPGEQEGVAQVFVFDEIGGSFGVNATDFAAELEGVTAPRISLRINSPGGSVFDGIAIHSALLHHPARVRTYVDGLAASAASVVAQGADPLDGEGEEEWGGVLMMPGAEMMIHKASMTVDGNDDDTEKATTFLRRQSQNIAEMYAGRAGGDPAEWMALMAAETWMFGREAVEFKLADKVAERERPVRDERMKRAFDLSAYRYAGRRAAPTPRQVRNQYRDARDAKVLAYDRHGFIADRVIEQVDMSTASVGPVAREGGSSADQPQGRSIALIEAQIAALTADD